MYSLDKIVNIISSGDPVGLMELLAVSLWDAK